MSDGACTLKTYRTWRDYLYKEGYAETILSTANRLLATEELETADQYFWGSVLETSSREKISARNAMGTCFFYSRLILELMPKPVSVGHTAPSGGEPGPKNRVSQENLLKKRKTEPERSQKSNT